MYLILVGQLANAIGQPHMGNQISDADDINLSSAVTTNDITDPNDRRMVGHEIAIDRFRQVMKATGGRFAEMTAEEEGEIVAHLAIFAQRLRQPSEGMTE